MVDAIREHLIVEIDGSLTIKAPELTEGTQVEVIIVFENGQVEKDTTEYLLSSEANRGRLLNSIKNIDEHPETLIPFDVEAYEKSLP